MTDSALHFAKRELRSHLRDRRVWIGMFAAATILGVVGPYDTSDSVRPVSRFVYWGAVVVAAYTTGTGAGLWANKALERLGVGFAIRVIGNGSAAGAVVLPEMLLLNWLVLGVNPFQPVHLGEVIPDIAAISLVIAAASALWGWRRRRNSPVRELPRLLSRLSPDMRGTLVSLSVYDHYVEVTTTKGKELLLMRLSDAVAEANDVEGLRIHRSHWIALEHVEQAFRNGDRIFLRMRDGRDIPVSRAKHDMIRAAGLWPDGRGRRS